MMRPDKTSSLLGEIYWNNPNITFASRVVPMALFVIVPAAYLVGKYYVEPETCVADIRNASIVGFALLFGSSFHFWAVDQAKVDRAISTLMASRRFEFRRIWGAYEGRLDGRPSAYVSFYMLIACPLIYLIFAFFGCFWPASVQTICQREWMGNPSVAVVMTLQWMCFLALHQCLLSVLVLRPFARRKA
jgi:hypothetical protein